MSLEPRVVASWQRDAVHVWGWDGVQTIPPFRLSGRVPTRRPGRFAGRSWVPLLARRDRSVGRAAATDVRTTRRNCRAQLAASGSESRATRCAGSAGSLNSPTGDRCRVPWCPRSPSPHDASDVGSIVAAEVRWAPTTGPAIDTYLDDLAAAMPPICLPDVAADDTDRPPPGRRGDLRALRRQHGSRSPPS